MKRLETLALSIVLLALAATLPAQENNENRYTFLLTGASFASPNNGWFEVGCQLTDATPLNRAIGGEAIANTANRMAEGTLYTKEQTSLLFTGDNQQINGVKFGWHPENGEDKYIQRRMGAIFADTMRKIFP